MENILDLELQELKYWMQRNDENEFRAKQVFDWIYKNVWTFEQMSNLPAALRTKLGNYFYIEVPRVIETLKSEADDTHKFLLGYRDGNVIETVVMRYKHGNSVCVSTQIGCRMGCRFCASTIGGVVRNLSSGEILGQILSAQKAVGERISNVVLMGSGEPLDNYDNVRKFINLVNSEHGLNIGQRHIALSTCGIVPKINELAEENLQITLAISLHAPEDSLRKTMMPIAYRYSIEELMEACKNYINKTNRRITFEYSLVKGVNDGPQQAEKLTELLRGLLCHVNLIPVNEIKENSYEKSTSDNIKAFYSKLVNSGIETTIRKEMGADINAACGQLRRSHLEEEKRDKGV